MLKKNLFFILLLCFSFAHTQSLIPKENNKTWGYWDKSKAKYVGEGFQKALPFVSSLGLVKQNGKWGAVNERMKVIIPIEQDRIFYLTGGIFAYEQAGEISLHGMPNKSLSHDLRDAAVLKDSPNILVLADKKGLYGLAETNGKVIFPFAFCAPPKPMGDYLYWPTQKGNQINYGVYSKEGKEIIPAAYYDIEIWLDKYFKCESQDRYSSLFDQKGELLLARRKGKIQWVSDDFFMLKLEEMEENERNEEMREMKEIVVRRTGESYRVWDPQIRGGMVGGEDENGGYLIISPEGKLVKLAAGQKLVQIESNKIIVCQLDSAEKCVAEMMLDLEGNVLIPMEYENISFWNDRWAIIQPNKRQAKYGLIDLRNGEVVLPPTYQMIELYDHDYVHVYQDGQRQFLDPNLQPAKYSLQDLPLEGEYYYATRQYELTRLRANLPKVAQPQRTTKPDVYEKKVVPIRIDNVKIIRDKYNNNPISNLLVIRLPYKLPGPEAALMSIDGKAITGFAYTGISYYEHGLIHIYSKDTIDGWPKTVEGLMDFEGNINIPLVYDKINEVAESHIIVEKYGLRGVISRKNEVVIPIQYGAILYVKTGYFLIQKFGKWGIAKQDGTVITQPLYTEIKALETEEGGFEAKLNGKVIYLDGEGRG